MRHCLGLLVLLSLSAIGCRARSGASGGICEACRANSAVGEQEWTAAAVPFAPPAEHPLSGPVEQADDRNVPLSSFGSFHAHQGEINSLVVTRDGNGAYTAGTDGKVLFHSVHFVPGKLPRILTSTILKGEKPIIGLALSPDEKLLAVSQFSSISVYDLQNKQLLKTLTRVQGRVPTLAWDPRGEILALGRSDGDLFVWNVKAGPGAGKDSLDSLETYSGGASAIVRLAFHPKGRILFVGERGGTIRVWRLLRTEREMGLRDENADADKEHTGETRLRLGQLVSGLEDMWLNNDGSLLFALGSDGSLERYQVRGLVTLPSLSFSSKDLTAITGLTINESSNVRERLFVTAARDQRIKFWCLQSFTAGRSGATGPRTLRIVKQTKDVDLPVATDTTSLQSTLTHSLGSEASVVPDENVEDIGLKPSQKGEAIAAESALIGQTDLFATGVGKISASSDGPILWATQKKGILGWFDARLLSQSPNWRERVLRCRG